MWLGGNSEGHSRRKERKKTIFRNYWKLISSIFSSLRTVLIYPGGVMRPLLQPLSSGSSNVRRKKVSAKTNSPTVSDFFLGKYPRFISY